MKIIAKERNSSKTTECIKLSAENWYYIVCHNSAECHRIAREAITMELRIPYPITFDCFIRKNYHSQGIKGFIIDNAEWLLQKMTTVPIEVISLSTNNRKVTDDLI